MNQTKPELIELTPEHLCGLAGTRTYLEYVREFSGCFESSGEPFFVTQETRKVVPIVRPCPGQVFEGEWVAHEPGPFVVLDTQTLKLAFASPPALPNPPSLTDRPKLLVQAREVYDPAHGQHAVWEISRYEGDRTLHCLTPEINDPILALPYRPCLRVTPEEAARYVTEEIGWLAQQRNAITPEERPGLSRSAAVLLACQEILGEAYRNAIQGESVHAAVLRTIERNLVRARGKERAEWETAYAEANAEPERRSAVFERMAEASRHPTLKDLIQAKATQLIRKEQALVSRLVHLAQLQGRFLIQTTKTNPTMSASPALSTPVEASSHLPIQSPMVSTAPEPLRSTQNLSARSQRLRRFL